MFTFDVWGLGILSEDDERINAKIEIAKLMLTKNVDLSCHSLEEYERGERNDEYEGLLHYCISTNKLRFTDFMCQALIARGQNINYLNFFNITPVMNINGDKDKEFQMLELLISRGADLRMLRGLGSNQSILNYYLMRKLPTLQENILPMFRRILDIAPDIANIVDGFGRTPLTLTITYKDINQQRAIDDSDDESERDDEYFPRLDDQMFKDLIGLLLEKGADPRLAFEALRDA